MTTVGDVLATLETFTPVRWAFDFDNVGLLVGSRSAEVTGIVTALDPSLALVDRAKSVGAELVITHHPIFWSGTKSLTDRNADSAFALELARHGIAHITAHTNWDSAPGGINDVLAGLLGLEQVTSFGSAASVAYSKIVVFCQREQEDVLLDVMAENGAGNIGLYRRCGFKSQGIGTFEPLPGSNPYVGRIGKSDEIEETRIEMLCPQHKVDQVISAMIAKHNYEQPAFDVIPLAPLAEQPAGRIGHLAEPMLPVQFKSFLENQLRGPVLVWGDPTRMIERVAVVGGAADGEWHAALDAGADAFVTGEVKHHISLEAANHGFVIAAAGHYATENPGMRALATRLEGLLPSVAIRHFEPEAGLIGHPIA